MQTFMEKLERGDINLEPMYTFFKEDISPKDFAKLLDEFLYNYVILFIQSQSDAVISMHKDTLEFIHYLKTLRDIAPLCDKKQ
jgi:hypothetical protein